MQPPIAKTIPHSFKHLGFTFDDPYAWLQDKTKPDVIAYLEAENTYAKSAQAHTTDLQETLYQEMVGRIKEDDDTYPAKYGEYFYYSRTETGKQYRIFCRKHGENGVEEILVDENRLAEGHSYCRVVAFEPNPDQKLLAVAVDLIGNWEFSIFIQEIETGDIIAGPFEKSASRVAWANDNKTFFYLEMDDLHRAYQAIRRTVGSSEKTIVYTESDEGFYVDLERSTSGEYLIITSGSMSATEVHYLSADDPMGEWQMIAPRRPWIEYYVTHHSNRFLIRTNENAQNFKLMKTPVSAPSRENWIEVLPHRADDFLENVEAFANFLVLSERRDGLAQRRISAPDGVTDVHYISFPEPVYALGPQPNLEWNTDHYRFLYTSLITPQSVIDYVVDSDQWITRKRQEIPSGYDASQYESIRIFAISHDGARVPVSIVYKRGLKLDGQNPTVMYGYGSYGYSIEATFDTKRFSLMDRGFVFAIAHIRGGSEMGRAWYDNGRLMHKKNTFLDFIAAAEMLIAEGYTTPARLSIMGGSAGGLLVTAVMNMRPDLFKAVVALVPFTNVITAMLDATLPLTLAEYDQWGNPNEAEAFAYIRSYSPYDTLEAKAYPHLYIRTGLNDLQVPYWDPAKFTARLRALKTDSNALLLITNMGSGHGGSSGRYDHLREDAEMYAFLIDKVGAV
jgi:oligopeptidase B